MTLSGSALPGRKTYILCFVLGLCAYGGVAGQRLFAPSRDNHFVLQAEAWISGRVEIHDWPKGTDDRAVVTTVKTGDGRVVRGRFLQTQPIFRTTFGEDIPAIPPLEVVAKETYVSFPPFPAVIMLPQTFLFGRGANDVVTTVILAALALPLLLRLLTTLFRDGRSERTPTENLWLMLALAFGSVFFFSAVQGRVWFTAHVVGVVLLILYMQSSLSAKRPFVAGLCLACATLTRTPALFILPLFVLEAYRVHRWDMRRLLAALFWFGVPLAVLGVLAMVHNYVRFDSVTEFGHSYLAVRQQAQIETTGLFDWSYLAQNLRVGFGLLPTLSTEAPFIKISGHGMALWLTSPYLLYLLWPKSEAVLARSLWLCVALVAVPALLYQNTGWIQFGYRFSLDYMPLLIVLLALVKTRMGILWKSLIVWSIAVNAFGAITFARFWQFYDLTY
jgi:hypothetical protein